MKKPNFVYASILGHVFCGLFALGWMSVSSPAEEPLEETADLPEDAPQPLSSAQADAIISGGGGRQGQRYVAKRSRLAEMPVIQRKEVDLGNRKVILNRVEPPAEVESPPAPAPAPTTTEIPEEELARLIEQASKQRSLSISATVYDGQLTRLGWSHDGKWLNAWSNVDFNFFCGVGTFSAGGSQYSLFMMVGDDSREAMEARTRLAREKGVELPPQIELPDMSVFTPGRSEYLIEADDGVVDRAAYAAIDALHAYYDANREELTVKRQRREALRAARERYKRAHPEEPKDTVINFWPKRGSAYLKGVNKP